MKDECPCDFCQKYPDQFVDFESTGNEEMNQLAKKANQTHIKLELTKSNKIETIRDDLEILNRLITVTKDLTETVDPRSMEWHLPTLLDLAEELIENLDKGIRNL